jgi:hypothetical protein
MEVAHVILRCVDSAGSQNATTGAVVAVVAAEILHRLRDAG